MTEPLLDRLSNDLLTDPRVQQARQLIRDALLERQQSLTGVRPPDPARLASYDEALQAFASARGGGLYYPYLGSGIGNGPLVELADGSVKYDLISGIGVHICGHSYLPLIDELVASALSDTVMQGNLQQNRDSQALCEQLVSLAQESGSQLAHCFLSTSGAMANENALKMMFQAKFPAQRMLTFTNSFSGRTLALAQVTDRPGNRQGLPTTLAVDYVPFFDSQQPGTSLERSLAVLREHLSRYPRQHAGMCLELIQGEGGYYTAPREFFVTLFEELRRHDIPIFVDEVQTFGRTTRMFAFQHFQLDEYVDIVSIGKMSQVCATLFTPKLKPQPGLVSQTFTGSTSSIHAARFILNAFQSGSYLGEHGRTWAIHARFVDHFERLQTEHPDWISGPWGLGGMLACTVFDGSPEKTRAFLNRLYEAGVIAFPAGANPTRVRMLPPLLAIRDDQIDDCCLLIQQTLAELAG